MLYMSLNRIKIHSGHLSYFKDWNQFVANKLWAWEQTNLAWAKNFTGDTLVVYYDKLVDDVEGTVRTILRFINFPVDEVSLC